MSPPLEVGKHPLNESQVVLGAGDHPRSCRPAHIADGALNQADSRRFRTLLALDDIENDSLPFAEPLDARSLKSRDVDEYVLPTTIAGDEAEALVDIEPFHGAGLFDRCAGRWPAGGRRPETRSRWCRRRRGARIDAQHLGDVWVFMSRPDADLDGFARLHDADATLSQHTRTRPAETDDGDAK
jgi:hypothetical protein